MPYRLLHRYFSTVAWVVLASLSIALTAHSQDYLGVLNEMLTPEVTAQLQLTEEQQVELKRLVNDRRSAAIGLAQMEREAPRQQRAQLRQQFGAESERLAFQLLNPAQQSQLAKLRVQWRGMLALADADVARDLNLANWQQDTVAEWLERVNESRRSDDADRVRDQAERAIRQELSDSQWAAWQVLAGQLDVLPEPPVPPERNIPAETLVSQASSQEGGAQAAASRSVSETPIEDVRLTLNFNNVPWKDVIDWLAEEADLSVQNDIVPPGSFKYHDRSRTYSVIETLDLMNASLLDKGYTFFRQDRMLRCVDFESDDIAPEAISAMADRVTEEELASRGKYEPVTVIFALERLEPEDVAKDIEQLLSVQGTVFALPLSGQVKVTDMAGNVRTIAAMIKRAEDPHSSRGASIQSWELKHIVADEVLDVARPLLGLEEDSNTSDEISISTDAFGSRIFAKGDADKIQNLKDLITQMDVVPVDDGTGPGTVVLPEFQRHQVVGIELQLAYDIVSQMLAGAPGVRLAQNVASNQLILEARPDEQERVRQTLSKLAGEASDFKVIQLRNLDTQMAIAAIKKFFNLTDDADGEAGGPVIDGDLLARQVWIKGSATQIQQIEQLLSTLESKTASNELEGIKVYPGLKGDALSQVKALWEMRNGSAHPIREIGSIGGSRNRSSLPERSFPPRRPAPNGFRPQGNASPEPADEALQPAVDSEASVRVPSGKLTAVIQEDPSASDSSSANSSPGAPITIMEGPNGLIVASDDPEVLREFDSILRMVNDQALLATAEPTIIYLTNIKAEAAKELLTSILSGTSSSSSGGGGLLGDMAGAVLGGGFGSLLGGGGGDLLSSSSGISSGDYSMIADPRLNCLIVQANAADMRLIEQLVSIIDQVESPYSIETRGQLRLIPVITQDVATVLNTIKSLYGDRIEGNSSGGGGGRGGGGGGGQPDPAAFIQALRGGGGRGGGGNNSQLAEPKISLGADEANNMLIVMAQPKQIAEIEELVAQIDLAGAANEEVVDYAYLDGWVTTEVLQQGLLRILGPQARTSSSQGQTAQNSGSSSGGGGGDTSDAAAQARRAAFFESLRNGGGGFGGRGGTTGGGGGFTPGGFGGFGGRGGTTGGFGGFGGRGGTTGGFGGRGGTGGGTGGRGGR